MLPASGRHDRSVHLYVTGALGGDVSWKAALWEWPRLYQGVRRVGYQPLGPEPFFSVGVLGRYSLRS